MIFSDFQAQEINYTALQHPEIENSNYQLMTNSSKVQRIQKLVHCNISQKLRNKKIVVSNLKQFASKKEPQANSTKFQKFVRFRRVKLYLH